MKRGQRIGRSAFVTGLVAVSVAVPGVILGVANCETSSTVSTSSGAYVAPMATPALPPAPPGEIACPPFFAGLRLDHERRASCWCPTWHHGAVWGTGQYTTDSELCKAVTHAGAVPAGGGRVTLQAAPGCPRYVGSSSNGVQTSSWGSYGGSFVVVGHAEPTCTQRLDRTTPIVAPSPVATGGPTIETTGDVQISIDGVDVTPAEFATLTGAITTCPSHLPVPRPDAPTTRITCRCAAPIAAAPVWGDRRYALDSGVCSAALHAGAITPTGGVVRVQVLPGCERYAAAKRGGVASRTGEATDASFAFDADVEAAPTSEPPPCPR